MNVASEPRKPTQKFGIFLCHHKAGQLGMGWLVKIDPTTMDPKGHGTPWAPYHSHNTPIFESLKIWEVYGSRFPEGGPMSLGVPGITLDKTLR